MLHILELFKKNCINKDIIPMPDYLALEIYIEPDKNMIFVAQKECENGPLVASEPVQYIKNTEWENVSKYIINIIDDIAKDPYVQESSVEKTNVMKKICGNKGFRQFSKKHIAISVAYHISEQRYILSNEPRLRDGSYGVEKETLSEKYSTQYSSPRDTAAIQENFLKAYNEALQYLQETGNNLFGNVPPKESETSSAEEPTAQPMIQNAVIQKASNQKVLIQETFGYKCMWFALKNADINTILSNCSRLSNAKPTTWEAGLRTAKDSSDKAFLSGAYKGWTFLVGFGLCEPTETENFMTLMSEIGKCADEVCFFATHRVVELQCFAQSIHGKLNRYYCYCGESGHIYANIGDVTGAEKELSLNLPTNDAELFEEEFSDIDETDILLLAEKMSMNPELLIGMKEQRCIIADILKE